jgi:hypothetical protein
LSTSPPFLKNRNNSVGELMRFPQSHGERSHSLEHLFERFTRFLPKALQDFR